MNRSLAHNFKSVVQRRDFSDVVRKCLKQRDKRPAVAEQRERNSELDTKAAASGLGWRIVGATSVLFVLIC